MNDLTKGNEGKLIFRFAVPMLIGNVFQQLYNVVDSIIVGNYLGKEALSAVGAAFPIMFTLISVIIGFASGTTIVVSQYFGARQYANVKKAIDTLLVVLWVGGLLLGGIGILFMDEVLRLIELPQEVIPLAKDYMVVIFAGFFLTFGFNGTSAVLRGMGDSKTPLYFLIISTIMNILLDFIFVLGLDMGVQGVAFATVIAQSGAFFTAVIYLRLTHQIIDFKPANFAFSWEFFRKSIRIGLPVGAQNLFLSLGMVTLMRIVNMFGTPVIAAYTVAGRLNSFAMIPAMNFSMALSTFVGQNIGANKMERVQSGLKSTIKMTVAVALLFTVIAMLFARPIMSIFNDDPKVIQTGVDYFRIVASFYMVFSLLASFSAVFRGAGDTIIPMFTTLLSLWLIRIPAAYFLSNHLGEEGIWWSVPTGWFFGAAFGFYYYLSGRWKRKTVVTNKGEGNQGKQVEDKESQ